ncbi:S41 family peptidase [Hoeflea prorocentri]|uniref:S41 family peptidase n=1 Tax=Hoeflea prorocentri TaxID=1922333 RepID=A0A9X3ZH09_9HYPH|nr:S41 family peptidase [Hoeflea prorocentri]MCY6380774.1 S41 family peptidase [Hoeflea prorocentri]MDA5398574.1 S41 family peptidase [Hoeflea prorocentri]
MKPFPWGTGTFYRYIFAILICLVLGMPVAAEPKKYMSAQKFKDDLFETYNTLKRFHPHLYAHTSPEELDKLHAELMSSVSGIVSINEAYLSIYELVGAVCDEHTLLLPDKPHLLPSYEGWPWFRYHLIVAHEKLFSENPDTNAKDEIVSINGINASDIVKALTKKVGHDGCLNDEYFFVSDNLNVSGQLVSAIIGARGPFDILTKSPGANDISKSKLEANSHWKSRVDKGKFRSAELRSLGKLLQEEGFVRPIDDPSVRPRELDYRYSVKRNLAYLNINSFGDTEVATRGVELVMRDIINKKPDALFIDLVDNSGGAISTTQLIAAFLLPTSHRLFSRKIMRDVSRQLPVNFEFLDETAENWRQHNLKYFRRIRPKNGVRIERTPKRSLGKPDYKGPIYILVNPKTRSASIRLTTVLKLLRDAKIVGAVSAAHATVFCARASGGFTLKNSGFILQVPDVCFENPEAKFAKEGRLSPDIEIDPLGVELANFRASAFRAALDHYDNETGHKERN